MGNRQTLFIAAIVATLVLLGLTGCAEVEVEPSPAASIGETTTTASIVTPAAERHDVGITAVDFEPPLQSEGELASDKVTLLVALENMGNRPEKNLAIRVRLSSTNDGEVLAESLSALASLVPGESKIVRFETMPSLPLRPGYSLKTDIDPVPGEVDLSNNTRTHLLQFMVTPKR